MTEPSPHVSGSVFWFSLLVSVAVTLAGVALAVGAYTAVGRPDGVVLAYFAALARNDAAGALGYGSLPPDQSAILLTSTVLAAQNAAGPIEDVTVRRVRQTGATARVDVGYTVALRSGPVAVADVVPVVRVGRAWRLVQTFVTERIRPGHGADLASLAGFAVPRGRLAMFPGAVPVTYATPLLSLSPGSRIVRFAGGGSLTVDATVGAAGRTALTRTVTAELTACLAGRSRTEELCPAPDGDAAVPGSLRGTLTGPPALTFDVPSADGRISVTGTVDMAATFRLLDDDNIAAPQVVRATPVHGFGYATRPGSVWWGS